jgi:hypothetical protein
MGIINSSALLSFFRNIQFSLVSNSSGCATLLISRRRREAAAHLEEEKK